MKDSNYVSVIAATVMLIGTAARGRSSIMAKFCVVYLSGICYLTNDQSVSKKIDGFNLKYRS